MTAKEKLEKSGTEKVEKLTKQSMEREQQLTALLQETETRHSKKPNVIFLLFPGRSEETCFSIISGYVFLLVMGSATCKRKKNRPIIRQPYYI